MPDPYHLAVLAYLASHPLRRIGNCISFHDQLMTMDQLVERVRRDVRPAVPGAPVAEWVAQAVADAPRSPVGPESPAQPRAASAGTVSRGAGNHMPPSFRWSYDFWLVSNGDTRAPLNPQEPPRGVGLQARVRLLPSNGQLDQGFQATLRVMLVERTLDFAPAEVSARGAWVLPFLRGALNLQATVAAAVGVAGGGPAANGSAVFTPTLQASAEGQVTYTVAGTGESLRIGFRGQASVSGQPGNAPAFDYSGAAIVEIAW